MGDNGQGHTVFLRMKHVPGDGRWHSYVCRVDTEGRERVWIDGEEVHDVDWNAMLRGFFWTP